MLAAQTPDTPDVAETKALVVTLEAKPGRAEEVQKLLERALPIIRDELDTVHWYALKLSSTTFGIFDTFADEEGRQSHLSGKVAAAMKAKAPEVLAKPPLIEKVDVLAVKR
ncbi:MULTISPECIES: putative quinol monooxygenase [Corallococcus]|uniref:putative quinol monooxygenase n=1 Tax=Corallococcus sp. Z5C101001 TaxID=2596829 RepID=UPI001180A413|nr:antibiotic biosynthesis monooxygenase [Corallococcus silvisoli]TSC31952.1 antibiotic biosynthesis monooxygenase [Corallococcus sp. Z5C101001]